MTIRDVCEVFWVFSSVLWATMLLLLLIVLIASPAIAKGCHNYGEIVGLESKWDFWATCYVEVDGEWISREVYERRQIARDGLLGRN